jgi:PAS domain S-box-containing protein
MCVGCDVFKANIDVESMEQTLTVVNRQFTEFRSMVEERDRELEETSMELALGLSEVFEGLRRISSGDPEIRIPETSKLELIAKLKHMVNLTAINLAEIVNLSHEFAMGLAEHFDVLLRVSQGRLDTRVSGVSEVELLESLKQVTNQMIESVSEEITHRTLTAAAFRESQERYRVLFDYDPNSIFVLEFETFKILDVNARGLEVYGYKKEELVGKSFTDLGPDQYPEGVLSQTKIASSILCSEYSKVEHRAKDGRVFYVNVYACQTKHGGKRIIIVTTVDITESVMKEAQLIQADKMSSIGEMAAGVAHEVNNPIAIVLGFTELLLERFPGDSKEFMMLETIERQAVNCKRIIENLLTFTRIPHEITTVTDVVASLERVVSMVKNTLMTKKVVLHTNVEEPILQAKGDAQQIEQVFLNIINNAVAAMDGGGTLTISAQRSYDMVSIAFKDTGHGISPEHIPKIFEPFFTTKKVGEGTGLGLSVSYGIVKKFGGDIQVKSRTKKDGEESGTIFTVTLPAADVGNRESNNEQKTNGQMPSGSRCSSR